MNNIETALNSLIAWIENHTTEYVANELSKTHNKEFCDRRITDSKHTVTKGKKYFKVSSDGSVRFFVDQDGNIYKPASWAAPAKGIRGNLFSDNKGHEAFHYGGCGLVFVNCAR